MSNNTYLYELITYDLLGNEEDGFEVNDAYRTNDFIEIQENDSDEDIVNKMKLEGLISTSFTDKLVLDGEAGYSLYASFEKDGKPAFELRRVDED